MSANTLKFIWPDKSKLSRGAFKIVRTLRKSGFSAFIAGGAVRDALLKRPLVEIDIATAAKPETVRKLFAKTIPTGLRHGTVTVREDELGFEVTTYRVEGPYRDYRRPQKVKFVRSPEEDAKRRDFTVNALFYDPDNRTVIDYVNGIADLAHKRINLVGEAEKRIKEDALRMLRAVRFAATLSFALSRRARTVIQKSARLVGKISAERVKQELDKIISSDRASVGVGLMDVVGLLAYVLPEVKALQGVLQPKNQHAEGDVYAHTLLALERFDERYDLPTRYAVFFHDLGKAKTRKIRDGKITFYDHQNVGAELARRICRRLRFGNADAEKITWLVRHHMVPFDFVKMKLSTRRKWGLNPYFKDLLLVYLADVASSLPPSGRPNLKPAGYAEGLKISKELELKPIYKKPLLSGRDVMRTLKISEGPLVGKVLRMLEELKLSGRLRNKAQALSHLRQNKKHLVADS